MSSTFAQCEFFTPLFADESPFFYHFIMKALSKILDRRNVFSSAEMWAKSEKFSHSVTGESKNGK